MSMLRPIAVILVIAIAAGLTTLRPLCTADSPTPSGGHAAAAVHEWSTQSRTSDGAETADVRITAALVRKDYATAFGLVEVAVRTRPDDFVLRYTGACALALLGRTDDAIVWLEESIRRGFRDFDLMVEDPDLASLRGDSRFVEMAAGTIGRERAAVEPPASEGRRGERRRGADVPPSQQAERGREQWRERFGDERYHYEYDAELRVHLAIALDEDARGRMGQMLRAQGRHQIATLFGAAPADPVFVAVPLRSDARTFFRELGERDATFDSPGISGIYEHRPRRLVSTDIGAALRHEFTHALHYGHMERLRQPHPLWIQEGLATLYEDYDLRDDGTIVFRPNERHNVMRGSVRAGRVIGWRELAEMDGKTFMDQAQRTYPHVRSIFEFIADRGLLQRWYETYTTGFAQDSTGIDAIEQVFAMPLANIEREWRQWVLRRPIVVTAVRYGGASLGIEVDDASDGARILRVRPSGGAANAGLRRNDVIVAVDDRAIASSAELVASIAPRRVGDAVRLRIRRDGEYVETTARLEALRPD